MEALAADPYTPKKNVFGVVVYLYTLPKKNIIFVNFLCLLIYIMRILCIFAHINYCAYG